MSGSNLRASIVAARTSLQQFRSGLQEEHAKGASGTVVCQTWVDRLDGAVVELFEQMLEDLDPTGKQLRDSVALVAHGGLGRRDAAPYSDLDLMLLIRPNVEAIVKPLAGRLIRDVGDVGLSLGQSVRTVKQACQLSTTDPVICTSLMESRLLAGPGDLFASFQSQFQAAIERRAAPLFTLIEQARADERLKFGDTVFLLEPNLKRSRGGLRDYQLLRWIGALCHGSPDLRELRTRKALSAGDVKAIEEAHDYLLRLRNELHFHAKRAKDVLDRQEQFRISALWTPPQEGVLLPVERFMQEYFRRTQAISAKTNHFVDGARPGAWKRNLSMLVLSHRLPGDMLVGPADVRFTREGIRDRASNLASVLALADASNAYDRPIEYRTSEAVRRGVRKISDEVDGDAAKRFITLLETPGRLGDVLRNLHDMGVLEKVLPDYGRIRGLLSFSEDHRYTIDEHSFMAVEIATRWQTGDSLMSRLYRPLRKKWLLHLALLLHDVGKGLDEDHSIASGRAARAASERLGLTSEDAGTLLYLVEKHLRLPDLAFRRDTSDPRLMLEAAEELGSPERLRLLFLLTVADMSAVAPGVWNAWKEQVLVDLYRRLMGQLAGGPDDLQPEQRVAARRNEIRAALAGPQTILLPTASTAGAPPAPSGGTELPPVGPPDEGATESLSWEEAQIDQLPMFYLLSKPPQQVAQELRRLRSLAPNEVWADVRLQPETESLVITIGARAGLTDGMFHKLAGAMACKGLEILSAEICTLAEGVALDRFTVRDDDFNYPSPPDRLEELAGYLSQSLRNPGPPPLDRARRYGRSNPVRNETIRGPQAAIDNATSDRCTIIDVFSPDQHGLLYAITRTIYELRLSVVLAKITTAVDQAADVFYVTEENGAKVTDLVREREIRLRLETRLEAFLNQPFDAWIAGDAARRLS